MTGADYYAESKAAVDYAQGQAYSGSVEALGLTNAFYFGALNEGSSSPERLLAAFAAGLAWNRGNR